MANRIRSYDSRNGAECFREAFLEPKKTVGPSLGKWGVKVIDLHRKKLDAMNEGFDDKMSDRVLSHLAMRLTAVAMPIFALVDMFQSASAESLFSSLIHIPLYTLAIRLRCFFPTAVYQTKERFSKLGTK